MKITIKELANRKRKGKMFLTEEETIQVFELIPEGCERRTEQHFTGIYTAKLVSVLRVHGLGTFVIIGE